MEQYLWHIPIRTIKLMSMDATKVIYLSEKQQQKIKEEKSIQRIDNPMDLLNDFGIPVFNNG